MQKNEQKCKDVGNIRKWSTRCNVSKKKIFVFEKFRFSIAIYKSMNFAQTVYLYMFSFQQRKEVLTLRGN